MNCSVFSQSNCFDLYVAACSILSLINCSVLNTLFLITFFCIPNLA